MNPLTSKMPLSFRVLGRSFAAQAAPKASEAQGQGLLSGDVIFETLKNGFGIGCIETNSPLSSVTVIVRGGSRAETGDSLGASHTVRRHVGLSSKSTTSFLITRNLNLSGCSLTSTGTREYIATTITGLRENVNRHVDYVFESALHPAFKPWELHDNVVPKLKYERALLDQDPSALLTEAIHKAALRGGLSNSIVTPAYKIGKHSRDELEQFIVSTAQPGNVIVLATGVEKNKLAKFITLTQSLPKGKPTKSSGESRFLGTEVRLDTDSPITHIAVVSEGVSTKNIKDRIALSLFTTIMGNGARLPYSNAEATPLGRAIQKAGVSEPAAAASINVSYSDVGLCGIRVACDADEARPVLKACVGAMRETAKSLTDKDVKAAKQNLKASLMLATEGDVNLLNYLTEEVGRGGAIQTPSELARTIDTINTSDVQSIAQRVAKGRGALAAVGRLHNVPHLDELA